MMLHNIILAVKHGLQVMCLSALLSVVGFDQVAHAAIPTPESVLGFKVGADFKMASYNQSIDYFRALAAASDRVELRKVGKTSEGRDWYIALISNAENLAKIEHYRGISQRLANPEGLTDATAMALAREGKAFVSIDGGVHATETATSQHTIQLAYDIVSEKDGDVSRDILENVILILWPSLNPDGQEIMANWYAKNLGTPYETSSPPQLYQKYVGHDNNRDGYGINMIESRVVVRTKRYWEPQVMYSHHMTSSSPATIWLPPYGEPIYPDIHPLMSRMVNLMGTAAAASLDAKGLPGAEHKGEIYDAWYPGYIDFINFFHNIVVMFSETGIHSSPTPQYYTVRDFSRKARELRPGTLHASLWRGGWWRLRDSVDYMVAASSSTLEITAKFRQQILYNRYKAGIDNIMAFRNGPPYAYFIPQQQRDPVAAVEMLRRIAFQNVKIHQLTKPMVVENQRYDAGTWVIKMDQPNSGFIRSLMAVQDYPNLLQYSGGPPDLPYDHAGWTLPYQFGVRTVVASVPLEDALLGALKPVRGQGLDWDRVNAVEQEVDAAPFDSVPGVGFNTNAVAAGIIPPKGKITGKGPMLALDPAQNNSFRAINQALAKGARISFDPGSGKKDFSKAIYKIEGDTLELCFSKSTKLDRPKDFDTAGTRYLCFTLNRVEILAATPAIAQKDASRKDAAKLQGTWKVSALWADGKQSPKKSFEKTRFLIKGDKISLTGKPEDLRPYRMDATAKPKAIDIGSDTGKPRYLVSGLDKKTINTMVSDLALAAGGSSAKGVPVKNPRIGLYRSLRPSMDEGWTRWLLEMYDFDFVSLYDTDVRSGDLLKRYDVIVFADLWSRHIIEGAAKGTTPPRYTGGIGAAGVRALDAFVKGGGTLVTMNGSSLFAIDNLHLPVKNVVAKLSTKEFYTSGSILEVIVNQDHPIMAGMPERAAVIITSGPIFTVKEGFKGRALAKFDTTGSPLMSGFMIGEKHLHGYAVGLDVEHGDGNVILLGFRPQWRAQPFGTFRVLFNSLMYSGAMTDYDEESEDFWVAPDEPVEKNADKDNNGSKKRIK